MGHITQFIVFLGAAILAALLAWSLNWLALRSWRRSVDAHWTERARILFPVRKAAILNLGLIPASFVLAQQALPNEWALHWSVCAGASFFGALAGSYPLDRAIFPTLRFKEWAGLATRGWLLRLSLFGCFFCLALYMPQEFGWRVFVLGAGAIAFLFAINLGLLIHIWRVLGLVEPAPARLECLVAETAMHMNLSFKRVWLMESPTANALAFVTTRELMFTSGLLENLTDEEIKSVCAHEMGHLAESKATMCGRIAGSCAFLPVLFWRPLEYTFGPVGPLVALTIFLIGSTLSKRFARRLEVRADKTGKDNEMQEGNYARALERLCLVNHMPAVMPGKRTVHPHLYDRLVAAGFTPTYPRPKAPGKVGTQTLLLIALIVVTGLIVLCIHIATQVMSLIQLQINLLPSH